MRCTGLTARYCDRHGTCTCPLDPDNGWVTEPDGAPMSGTNNGDPTRVVHDPGCPLHGHQSNHPIGGLS